MSISILPSPTADIVYNTRRPVNALNADYPLRRVEMELFPTEFCRHLLEETSPSSGRPKAPTTMPRAVFDSLYKVAALCTDGNISASTFKLGGLCLNHFQMDALYPFCLFQNGKVVVPHDSVFLTLHQLHTHAISHQLELKTLVYDLCAFVPFKVVHRFLCIMKQTPATPSLTPQQVLAMKMSTFGLNVTAAISSIQQMVATTPLSNISQNSALRLPLDVPALHVATTPPSPVHDVFMNRIETTEAPSTPRPSRKRPISAHSPSPLRHSNNSSLVRSSSWLSLTKRLFTSELSSVNKKTRVLEDISNTGQGEQDVAESSKMAGKRRHRVHKKRDVPPMGRTLVIEDSTDDIPQTSPITKVIPGSFLLRGERLDHAV